MARVGRSQGVLECARIDSRHHGTPGFYRMTAPPIEASTVMRDPLHFSPGAEHTMAMPAMLRRRWTADEVRNLQDESRAWPRYELIDGELYVTPSPGFRHQAGVQEIVAVLRPYVIEHGIGGLLTSPADIELEPESVLQPDLFVFAHLDERVEDPTWKDIRSLLLAVEIISPSSIRTDRIEKRDQYLKMPVDEYWVVDMEGLHIERWFKGRSSVEVARDELTWHPAGARAALSVDLPELFRAIRRFPR
jgi:Uma2 family endonuclease